MNNNYQLVYTACAQCHQNDFNGTTNPNHVTGGFPTLCATCHSTTAWQPATFDHSTTKFPLTGAHVSVACNSCHVNNNYQLVYTACAQCHQNDFNTTTNPNHVTSGFPTLCQTCHTTAAWQPASFDHSATKFPLTGAHTTVQCASCHINSNYQLVYTDCYACHQSSYTGATNPNHATQAFPHLCSGCHQTTVWTTLTYNHDTQYFRIYSGAHNGNWALCITCHTTPGDFTGFSCTTSCHSKTNTDNDHRGVSGYQYSSPACYSCHRNV